MSESLIRHSDGHYVIPNEVRNLASRVILSARTFFVTPKGDTSAKREVAKRRIPKNEVR